ncbi:hypothetical protein B0H63DRAFT_480828 [Podospora didyma]|uniref:Uncharacterized protein n=1 Tax=Podospora didyma TaxID=330526 RepID=A0AAE0N970_9PEZI|nr:hypothetical protein B0H63DRAFT_480828 [Podospora didyma]
MSPSPLAIQVINKTDHTEQHVVTLPEDAAPAPLTTGSNSVRILSRTIALTTNNFSYAMLGGIPMLGWWNVWPMPASLPQPFNDASKYCRISAWGWSEVVESTISDLPVGARLYGYQPIGTLPETLELTAGDVPGHWFEVSNFRKPLMPVYNRYYEANANDKEMTRTSLGYDALMRTLFETGFALNKFVFAWPSSTTTTDSSKIVAPIHPLGQPPWSQADADVTGATIIMLAASGKTALSLAYLLRQGRPTEAQPKRIVAVGSDKSRGFTANTKFFDKVLIYDDVTSASVLDQITGDKPNKIVLLNFGARGDAAPKWMHALKTHSPETRVQVFIVGGEPVAGARGGNELMALAQDPTSDVRQVNMGGIRAKAMADVGAVEYFAHADASWNDFKQGGGIPELELKSGQGLDAFSKGWDALVKGEAGADTGLIYEL